MRLKNSLAAFAVILQFTNCATSSATSGKEDFLLLSDKTEQINTALLSCQRFEKKQNIWTGIGIGAASLSGSAGLGVIPTSDNSYAKWTFASISVATGMLAALSAGMTKIYSDSFREHKCSEIYTKRADMVLNRFAIQPAAQTPNPPPAPPESVATPKPVP